MKQTPERKTGRPGVLSDSGPAALEALPAFIDQICHPVIGLGSQKMQGQLPAPTAKEPDSLTQQQRNNGDIILVNQIPVHQLADQVSAAADPDCFPLLRL